MDQQLVLTNEMCVNYINIACILPTEYTLSGAIQEIYGQIQEH
jgi:hypothetical protein